MALLCAQGVKLHIHSIDHTHDYDQQYGHVAIEAVAEHSHQSKAHLSSDISHSDHQNEMMPELDASPDGLLKKAANNIVTLALIVTVLSILLLSFHKQLFFRRHDEDTILPWRYLLSPPPRAPPL